MAIPEQETVTRGEVIAREYFAFLDRHLDDLLAGRETEMLHINEIAQRLFIAPVHLSNTIKLVTGNHPCYYFDKKIIDLVQQLLLETQLSSAEIARRLTFDPSNFNKFYKKLTGETPAQFREKNLR